MIFYWDFERIIEIHVRWNTRGKIQIWMKWLETLQWPYCTGKCMAIPGACVLSKRLWQHKIFSGYLQGERQLRSVLPMFTLDWDLFSLVFFSFSISSDLKPGRIILTCLKAIFNLTLSFSSSPMNVNHRANIQGELRLANTEPCENKTFPFSRLFFLLRVCVLV